MGYSYDADGLLCCDVCGGSGGVRKHKCPFGYCPAVALCQKCKHEHPEYLTKEYHREHGNCEEMSKEFERREAEKRSMMEQGKFLRVAALGHDGKGVKVIFRGLNAEERAYFMSRKTYRAIRLLDNVTVEDYKRIGRVTRAKSLDIYAPV